MTDAQLVWFKRDLRVKDHEPLVEACRRGPVQAFYTFEPLYLSQPETAPCHIQFIIDSLKPLAEDLHRLNIPFTVLHLNIEQSLKRIATQFQFRTLWSHEETGAGWSYLRDKEVKRWCNAHNVQWNEIPQFGVNRPHPSRNGWAKRWAQQMNTPLVEPPRPQSNHHSEQLASIPTLQTLGVQGVAKAEQQRGGSHEGQTLVQSFLRTRGEHYQRGMSSPVSAWEQCSRVSPHLAYGTISMRWLNQMTAQQRHRLKAERARGREIGPSWLKSLASFEKRLRWHCHFMQKLEDQPSLESQNMSRIYDGLRQAPPSDELFDAYCRGETGYPMVDACIRALRQTGWINFRMRAMLVSFASYHLWLPWQDTARFLARHFVDFEPGIHYPQVQMQSGTTGINTLRIYSPQKQVIDHDPTGVFLRRWVPELHAVPDAYLSKPEEFLSKVSPKTGYPEPIVDHKTAVSAARKAIYALRRRPEAKSEARAVFQKHGSRKRPSRPRKAQKASTQLDLL